MRFLLVVAGILATASAQAVTSLIVPSGTPLPDCQNSAEGTFGLGIQNATGFPAVGPPPGRRSLNRIVRRDISEIMARQEGPGGPLTMTLVGGVLRDQLNRTGYIASNYQFQFDGPPQAGAIYTAGWSICSNGSIALGGQAIFYECPSGAFYNLYDRNWQQYCIAINFIANGVGNTYSTAAPAAEVTGPSENSIANGGGTNTVSSTSAPASSSAAATSATITSAASSASAAATSAASSASESVSSAVESITSSASSVASSASSAAATAASTSFTGAAAQATGMPQQALAWAAGIVGAMVLV